VLAIANANPDRVRCYVSVNPNDTVHAREEIARCVAFLAADEAGFITGSTLTANGGQYLT